MNEMNTWFEDLDVYSQYFHAKAVVNGIERRAVIVKLTLVKDSEGMTAYKASASFFPFRDPEDFVISGDAYIEKIVYEGKKRRNKKAEETLLSGLHEELDVLVRELDENAVIEWEKPLREARYG